ncbi:MULTISPECIES: type II/IV secretion system ATPase subunit [Halomicrobium]|uniref:Type II secretion system protein E n=2 Tax=Halomicrobium mukohataei TaxID=57705 RepID=C7NWC3_HALMD|nr:MULTISPECIES: type II/IV secretion system ATPase subunit [Halomicrobium]ACV46264.1 type II secretion system protein E [Halomicrobium mukohataei DSM 12286]QCD64825.1 secretion system protein [Halomicrobium mukohataei]QFR19632.1 secretion system protein [Halomicrobium sp. ZPS1]
MLTEGEGETSAPTVPAPVTPDDPNAWYAPDVRDQDEIHPGVVVTVTETAAGFEYDLRDPLLSVDDADALATVEEYFADAHVDRPRTREGAIERVESGLDEKHQRVIDRLVDCSPASRRRLDYHALCSLACLGELTPYALDDRIDVADLGSGSVRVHTDDFAPAETDLDPDTEFLDRFASERLEQHTVTFHEFEIPVIVYRENVLGDDPFTTKYAVREPDQLPGDEELIEACKTRVWEASIDGVLEDEVAFVRDRARTLLSRQLTIRNTRAWFDAARYRLRTALAEYDLTVPPVDRRFADDRLEDLLYYVLRDLVGYGKLTVPVRDPTLEDIEANRVDERIKVVPRLDVGHNERVPTNLCFESERAFVNVVTKLAADDGTELNASTPSAKVNLSPEGVEETIRCAVALPTISEDGPHISIRKQSPDPMTPVDLIERDALPTELVALLWLLYEHHGVVLFCGPTGVGKTTLMNAHMPFIPYRDRPISIDEGSREVFIPHETGVSLTTRDHERDHRRVTMADLMTECNYLNPDVEVIAEVNTAASFETFAETLNTGHGLLGTTHAEDVETLVNRVVEQGLPPYLLQEIDLLVFPKRVGEDRFVGEVVEIVDETTYRALDRDADRCGVVRKADATVYWNTVCTRDRNGEFELAGLVGEGSDPIHAFERLADQTDQTVDGVEAMFERRHRYVQYLVQEGITDADELFALLADLKTDEAATVERLHRQRADEPTVRGEEIDGD